MAAPAILIVAPRGMATPLVVGSRFRRWAIARLMGMLAAELRVKKAVTPLSRRQVRTSG